MSVNLDERFVALKLKLQYRERLDASVARTTAELARLRARLSELEAEVHREEADVARYEGWSLARLLARVLGDAEGRLAREREEFLQAVLKHDECRYALATTERQLADLAELRAGLGDLEAERAELGRRKEEMIAARGGKTAELLMSLLDRIAAARAEDEELAAAVALGESAIDSLESAVVSLERAERIRIGAGGTAEGVSREYERSEIDDAKEYIVEAQGELRTLRRELLGAKVPDKLLGRIEEFESCASSFFGTLIANWTAVQRYRAALESVRKTLGRLEDAVEEVRGRSESTRERLERLETSRRALLEES